MISPHLFKRFFLRRIGGPISLALGLNRKRSDGDFSLNLSPLGLDLAQDKYLNKIFVKSNDPILPAYRDRKFWVWSGKRFVPVIVEFDKFGDKFGMYCYTKRYSPIHKGTSFVFKEIRGRAHSASSRNRKGVRRRVQYRGPKSSNKSVSKTLKKKLPQKKTRR